MATKPISKDAEFNIKLLSIIGYLFGTTVRALTQPAVIPGHAARLNISAANLTALWNLFYLWTDYYPKSLDPTLTSKPIRDNKNSTRRDFETLWSEIVGDMTKSALINDDRVALYLPARDTTPTETEAKQNAPQMVLEPSIHGAHNIRFINPDDPDKNGLPENQKIFLERYVGAANLADDQVPFNTSELVTSYLHEVTYTESDTGQTAYYRPRFITPTGKKGVAGVITKAVIS
jgi:hypothetical protein